MAMNCKVQDCGAPLAPHLRACVACGADGGSPNVRAAMGPDELTEFQLRYQSERTNADRDGYLAEQDSFIKLVESSKAVIGMPLARLHPLIGDPSALYATYALQLEGESRVPTDGRFDALRSSVENAFFPDYYSEIRFAALSLFDVGHVAYGKCSVALKDSAIRERASVFESPLFKFADDKSLLLGAQIPKGYRSNWGGRARLAAVKFSRRLKGLENETAFQSLLLPISDDTLSDCIEVHIFGPLNLHSFEKVTFFPETTEEDNLLQQSIIIKAKRKGILVECVQ